MTMSRQARLKRRQQADDVTDNVTDVTDNVTADQLPEGWYRDKAGRIRNEKGHYATLPEGEK